MPQIFYDRLRVNQKTEEKEKMQTLFVIICPLIISRASNFSQTLRTLQVDMEFYYFRYIKTIYLLEIKGKKLLPTLKFLN